MRRAVLTVLALLIVSGTAEAEVVGRIDGYEIVKEKGTYRIVPAGRNKRSAEHTTPHIPSKPSRPKTSIYQEIVYKLQHGAGEPVYSRIYGFNVDRVLDLGDLFGAVISGNPDPELLKKAFKYVVKINNRYYVVGRWEEK